MNRNNITDITIGIRYEKSFRIRDLFGEITDKICYSEDFGNPFDREFFSHQIQDNGVMMLRTNQNKKGLVSYIRLDYENIVFSYQVDESVEISESIEFIKKSMLYLCNLLMKYSILNFVRLGIIYNHKVKGDKKSFEDLCKKITGDKIKDFNDFSCRFSKRIKEDKALIDKKNKDFNNLIYNIWSSQNGMEIGLDYQYYFVPQKKSLEKDDISQFFKNSEYFINKYFYQSEFITNEKE